MLVLNQYYWPGFEATAHLLHELCSMLAPDFEVTVLTGMLPLPGVHPGTFEVDGVRVIRVASTSYPRSRLLLRGFNYVTYLAQALRVGLRLPRPDVILSSRHGRAVTGANPPDRARTRPGARCRPRCS